MRAWKIGLAAVASVAILAVVLLFLHSRSEPENRLGSEEMSKEERPSKEEPTEGVASEQDVEEQAAGLPALGNEKGCEGTGSVKTEGPENLKLQAAARILRTHAEVVGKRSLGFYVIDLIPREIVAVEESVIDTGHIVIGGKALSRPLTVRLGRGAITVNDLSVEPRYPYVGEEQLLDITPGMKRRGHIAQLIADKKEALYEEFGDYSLVIPKLAAFAKNLELVDSVSVGESMVKVVFAPETEGAEAQEVGYVCREMRRSRGKARPNPLRGLYLEMCESLRQGKTVLAMPRGNVRFEEGDVVERIEGLVPREVDTKTRLRDCRMLLNAVRGCFANHISEEEAAAILVNWRR